MKNVLLVTAFIIGSSQFSWAEVSIIGNWKLARIGCESGVSQVVPAYPGYTDSFTGLASATSNQIVSDMQFSIKMDVTEAAKQEKQIQSFINLWNAQPDSAQKQKSLADLNEALKSIRLQAAGVICKFHAVQSYKISGNVFHSDLLSSSTDCPLPGSGQSNASSDSIVELNGNTLKVITIAPEANGGSCPAGDHEVSIFTKIN